MLHLAINTYVHLLFIIAIFCTLIAELLLIKASISWNTLRKLSIIDGIYGMSALMVLVTGLLNWMVFGKGMDYYNSNTLFLTKLTLFIVVGILSIYPTVKILKSRKHHKATQPDLIDFPQFQKIRKFILAELFIMVLLPLLAELMANGIDI